MWLTGTMRNESRLWIIWMCSVFGLYEEKAKFLILAYISVVSIDDNGFPHVAIEGIICTEQTDSYIFAIKALLQMSPGRSHNDILAKFADGILSPSVFVEEEMNQHACFFWDRHHLVTGIWPKWFEGNWSSNMASMLQKIANSQSEECFQQALEEKLSFWMCTKLLMTKFILCNLL